ncbi:hypothetical protein J6N69_03580 [bacterium]|nr:hypothetical protein [bacterium]
MVKNEITYGVINMLLQQNVMSEENINIRYSEMDFDKSLKPFSLLNFFQDIASDNAERLGFGYSAITPKNLMWVLLKYRIEFEEYPVDMYNLRLQTNPRGYNKMFAFRNFKLWNGDKLLARASSMWSLVDFTNMSIANIANSIDSPYFGKYEKSEEDLQYEKIPALEKADFEKEFEVRYNDIDVNRHANNGNYIVWALEPLPFDFKSQHKLKTIDMVYKKEIKFGEKLTTKVQILEDKSTVHVLSNSQTGDDVCLVHCQWYQS